MNEVLSRTKNHFPGFYITIISIFVGLNLEDLVSIVRGTEGIWLTTIKAAVFWTQVATVILLSLITWITFAYIAMLRHSVPTLWDSVNVFLLAISLFVINSTIELETNYQWFLALCTYIAIGGFIMFVNVSNAVKEPQLQSLRLLLSRYSPLMINYLSVPFFALVAVISYNQVLTDFIELLIMLAALPILIIWMTWFLAIWRKLIKELEHDAATTA